MYKVAKNLETLGLHPVACSSRNTFFSHSGVVQYLDANGGYNSTRGQN